MSVVEDPAAREQRQCGEPGRAFYLCPRDGMQWSARAEMFPGNLDPAAIGRGDCCPTCRRECDQITDWQPDTPDGYQMWLDAPLTAA